MTCSKVKAQEHAYASSLVHIMTSCMERGEKNRQRIPSAHLKKIDYLM